VDLLLVHGQLLTAYLDFSIKSGAVRGINPGTGQYFDDTKRYLDAMNLSESDRYKIFEGNARKIFPRMKAGSSVELWTTAYARTSRASNAIAPAPFA
jgi:hypothetical protein